MIHFLSAQHLSISTVPPSVHSTAVYGFNQTSSIVYGQGLYCTGGNFSFTNCTAIDLLLDVFTPVVNATLNIPLPSGPMPVMLGIHGGSYTHGSSSMEYPNVEYFVQRGWIGYSINYRVCNQAPYVPPPPTANNLTSTGNLVCGQYGTFPNHAPFGNTSEFCTRATTFGLNIQPPNGCALSSPPKLAANASGHGRQGSFFGTLMGWMCVDGHDLSLSKSLPPSLYLSLSSPRALHN